ncbi:MAG TPA: helix-turn-helix domain-containing protein, partial [Mycobacteriales bacterium]|nr:helix-turn-helix domain-containing protein [Mycobacteriales bacterium]
MSDYAVSSTINDPTGGRLPRKERRAQLLAAARKVFVASGYHAAAMDDIAEQAGVSKPVLYQHFPGKLELYLALLAEQADELVARVRAAMNSTTDNRRRVYNALAAYFDYVDADGEAFRLIFESDLRNQPEVAKQMEQTARTCMSEIADLISTDT